jgi:hypothetical protein
MNEVKQRLRESLPVTLDEFEIEAIRTILQRIEAPDLNSVIGRFGPGATFEGFRPDEKWARMGGIPDVPCNLFRCSPRDTKCFRPFGDGYTKIAEVPKSIKSNRIVSSEPAMYMYAQLGVADSLVDQMHRIFAGHISLDDAERHNQALKFDGACSIDLSDASDHVSVSLVQALLPQLWPVLAKVRSEYSQTPLGVFKLETFAPMGSGVCFPVMTAVLIGITSFAFRSLGFRPEREKWSWYGDDGIVPIFIADYVCDLIERSGFKLNHAKSCFSGHYKESCGVELIHYEDAFKQEDVDVTPVYIKDPLDRLDAAKVEQIVRGLRARAFPSTADEVLRLSSAVIGQRWNKNLQRSELLVRSTSARSKLRKLDGYSGLNRWFAIGSQQVLDRSLRPSDHYGLETEVWTKPAWRFKPASNYPNLALWFATRA